MSLNRRAIHRCERIKRWTLLLILLELFLNGTYGIQTQQVIRKARHNQVCSLSMSTDEHNNYGVCKRFSECKSAQTAYTTKNIAPIYCKYDRSDPIVCCDQTITPDEPEIPDPTRSSKMLMRRKSEELCQKQYDFWAIVSGTPVAFKPMAALGWLTSDGKYEYLYGGTRISNDFVLTAAHCTSVRGFAPAIVQIGGENLDINTTNKNILIIGEIYVHPKYRRKQFYHDIALLRLNTTVFSLKACLWQTHNINYTQAIAIGYGHTMYAGKRSNELLKADLNIFPNEECSRYYKPSYKLESGIIDSQICVGDPYKMKDTCQGDSGGPLVVHIKNDYDQNVPYILGITSFGQSCAGGPPSIYIRVSSYLDWIESIVWP